MDVQLLQQANTPATTSRPVTASASTLHAHVSSSERTLRETATDDLQPALEGMADRPEQGFARQA